MEKIIIASFRHESNSFTPLKTARKDFIELTGEEVDRHTAYLDIFRDRGYDLIPVFWAYALPGGIVEEESYTAMRDELLESIPEDGSISGIWLYLHGAMEVENIGSGEADLVSGIRGKAGESVPIAAAFDFHANMSNKLVQQLNIICGYRTAPHVDAVETQVKAFRLLVKCVEEKLRPEPVMRRIPFIFPGELAVTGIEPLRTLMRELGDTENAKGLLSVSFFCGMAWIDSPNSMACIIAVDSFDGRKAAEEAERLARLFFAERERFGFEEETAEPREALRRAFETEAGPVFITDSGDNVTAGAPGDSAKILSMLIKADLEKRVLVAGILDDRAVAACDGIPSGGAAEVELGGTVSNEQSPAAITARLVWKGQIPVPGRHPGRGIKAAMLRSGPVDIIVTAERCAFTSVETIEAAGARIMDYHVIIVKQGYLFDGLRKAAGRAIMALTEGSASPDVNKFRYRRLTRPVYPLDKDARFGIYDS